MVICKYFLQGTCKFGDSCKFQHQISDHNYGNSSVLLQSQANKATNVDTNTLVKAVVNDMTAAEKGGQWLFSSYAPFKEKPAFPGFEDYSMEEIRCLFYESVKNGTPELFEKNLQIMIQQATMKVKSLQNPTAETIDVLKNIYNTPVMSSSSPFAGRASGNLVFGGVQAQKPSFGGSTGSIFGGGNTNLTQQSVFGNTSNPLFGGTQNANKSIFGGGGVNQQSSSVFGGQGGSIFGGSQAPPTGSPVFGTVISNAQSIFGGNQSPLFGGAPQPSNPPAQFGVNANAFASPVQQSQFTQNQTNSFFGTLPHPQITLSVPSPTPSHFAAQNTFGSPQSVCTSQSTNQFGGFGNTQNRQFSTTVPPATADSSQPSHQHTQNIFSNLELQNTSNAFQGDTIKEKPNEDFYSKLEDLTEEEIKWFQSDDLDIENIPEKPPTYEMCFRGG